VIATLAPREGDRYLHPAEVIDRVKAAFAYVETTDDGARAELLEWMSQLAFVAADSRDVAYDNDLARLEQLLDAAVYVHFGDDIGNDAALLSMLLVPGEPLFIEESTQLCEKRVRALLEHCAAALGYDILEEKKVLARDRNPSKLTHAPLFVSDPNVPALASRAAGCELVAREIKT
jgi:hypothetical protein